VHTPPWPRRDVQQQWRYSFARQRCHGNVATLFWRTFTHDASRTTRTRNTKRDLPRQRCHGNVATVALQWQRGTVATVATIRSGKRWHRCNRCHHCGGAPARTVLKVLQYFYRRAPAYRQRCLATCTGGNVAMATLTRQRCHGSIPTANVTTATCTTATLQRTDVAMATLPRQRAPWCREGNERRE